MRTKKIYSFIVKNKIIFLLSLSYFFFRLLNLTKLPIFNDESIYIDWGWKEIHTPGYLFYSLYDAKQPLLMWLFGISSSIFNNTLFASRFVSVLLGYISFYGIYKVGSKYFSSTVGYLASIFYIITPIFFFYDRQALMESAMTAVGIWLCYLLMQLTFSRKNAVIIGLIFGLGFLIKSTVIVFLFTYLLILCWMFISKKYDRKNLISFFLTCTITFFCIIFLLILQPAYWKTLDSNNRFSLTIGEVFHFPILHWLFSATGFLMISFFFLTPFIFISGVIGLCLTIIKSHDRRLQIFAVWFLSNIIMQIIFVRGISQRYTVVFLPYLLIYSAYGISLIKNKLLRKISIIFTVIPMIGVVLLQIINPINYIVLSSKISSFADTSYIHGFTSGLGVNEVYSQLISYAGGKSIYVGVAKNIGNPESAIHAFANKNKKIKVGFLESIDLPSNLDTYNCIKSKVPIYYVSREDQLAGLGKFFTRVFIYKNPFDNYFISIYKAKSNCASGTLQLELVQTP